MHQETICHVVSDLSDKLGSARIYLKAVKTRLRTAVVV